MDHQTVHLFVFDTLADWEPSYALTGINTSIVTAEPGPYRVQNVGLTNESVVTMGGLTILPDMTLDTLDPAHSALLILPGSDRWEQGELAAIYPHVRVFRAAGVPVAAICGATVGLAQAGVLDAVRHTGNAPDHLQATGYRGGACYEHAPAVTDSGVITAAGTAALEFAVHIFRCLNLYSEDILDAWYQLFKTGDPAHFARLYA